MIGLAYQVVLVLGQAGVDELSHEGLFREGVEAGCAGRCSEVFEVCSAELVFGVSERGASHRRDELSLVLDRRLLIVLSDLSVYNHVRAVAHLAHDGRVLAIFAAELS